MKYTFVNPKSKRNVREIFCVLFLLILTTGSFAQETSYEWVRKYGSASAFEIGYGVAADHEGNVYATGTFRESVDFDRGPGEHILTSAGSGDIYVTKMDAEGNFIWAFSIGNTGNDIGKEITIDADGNIIVVGNFVEACDFDPGDGTFELDAGIASTKTFILKLNAEGEFIWAKGLISGSSNQPYDLTSDDSGNIYICGEYIGTTDFDPGPAYVPMTCLGFRDGYVAKYDSEGNFAWARKISGEDSDYVLGVALDNSGNLFLTGIYSAEADLDPDPDVDPYEVLGEYDAYVQKRDTDGNFLWVKTFGGIEGEAGRVLVCDEAGNVYVGGSFEETVDFNPGVGVSNKTSDGGTDAFLQKLSPEGDFEWVNVYGAYFDDNVKSIVIDANQELYLIGKFWNTIDFNPGVAGGSVSSAGNSDVYILKIDTLGDYIWVESFGSTQSDRGEDIFVDEDFNVITTGDFRLTVDFDIGDDEALITATGLTDAFVHKIDQCVPTFSTDVVSSCDPYTWIDGIEYTEDNFEATYIYENADGCDSTVTLNLTINSNTGVDVISSCDPIVWIDGLEYTEDNDDATFTLTNIHGCDSVVTLNFDILSTTGTDVVTACDAYTWMDGIEYTESESEATYILTNEAGCDSIVTLNLTLNHSNSTTDAIVACTETYTWIDGITYVEDNDDATFTLTNIYGCDSVVTLNLSLYPIDLSVDVSATTLTSNEDGATYRWLNCNLGMTVISGETDQTYTPSSSGNYAVEVDNGICIDTSECMLFSKYANLEDDISARIKIYPNPVVDGIVNIQLDEINEGVILLYTMEGKLLMEQTISDQQGNQIDLNYPAGTYMIQVITPIGVLTEKLILSE